MTLILFCMCFIQHICCICISKWRGGIVSSRSFYGKAFGDASVLMNRQTSLTPFLFLILIAEFGDL